MVAHRTQLPPFVHHLQVSNGVAAPALAKCYDILATWEGFTSQSMAMERHILAEIDALVESVSYSSLQCMHQQPWFVGASICQFRPSSISSTSSLQTDQYRAGIQ